MLLSLLSTLSCSTLTLSTRYSLLTSLSSPHTVHCSLLTSSKSLSLLTTHHSLLPNLFSLLTTHHSPLTTHCSLLSALCALFNTHSTWLIPLASPPVHRQPPRATRLGETGEVTQHHELDTNVKRTTAKQPATHVKGAAAVLPINALLAGTCLRRLEQVRQLVLTITFEYFLNFASVKLQRQTSMARMKLGLNGNQTNQAVVSKSVARLCRAAM